MNRNIEIRDRNLELLISRFAGFTFLYFQLPKDIKKCTKNLLFSQEELKEWKKGLNLDNCDILFIYGLDYSGQYNILKEWLLSNEKKCLVFIEDDIEVYNQFLSDKNSQEAILNPQVYFYFLQERESFLEEISYKFLSCRINVATLRKKTKKFEKLKKEIIKDILLSWNAFHDRLNGYFHYSNFKPNVFHIAKSFYANSLKNKFKNIPAIVCGAGPSLMKSIGILSQLENKALIIAGGSTIAALSNNNILPHIGVIFDPNKTEFQRVSIASAFEVPILYSTRVNKDVFASFNGPLGYLKSAIGGIGELWMEEELKIKGEFTGAKLGREALSVTTECIAYAKYLGCNPIILDGIDLSFTDDKLYSDGILEDNNKKRKEEADYQERPIEMLVDNQKIYTNQKWLFESECISNYAKKNKKIKFINVTERGLGFKYIEKRPLKEIVETYLTKDFDIRSKLHSLIEQAYFQGNFSKKIEKIILKLDISFKKCKEYSASIFNELKNNNKDSGQSILSKMEIKDEIAYQYFLYDLEHVINKLFAREKEEKLELKKWELIDKVIDKYLEYGKIG